MQRALGALVDDRGTTFRIWSTAHTRCALRLYDDDGTAVRTEPLNDTGDGVYELHVPGVTHGGRYRFMLGDQEVNDPYVRFLPDGIHGPAMVVRPSYEFRHGHVVRPLREHVIYELHVGTFTDEGTYAAARARLGRPRRPRRHRDRADARSRRSRGAATGATTASRSTRRTRRTARPTSCARSSTRPTARVSPCCSTSSTTTSARRATTCGATAPSTSRPIARTPWGEALELRRQPVRCARYVLDNVRDWLERVPLRRPAARRHPRDRRPVASATSSASSPSGRARSARQRC